jgi:hypothetical protein
MELHKRKVSKDEAPKNGAKEDEEQKQLKKSPMEIAQEKYRKFFTRTIWGSLMIFFFAFILYTDHVLVCVFVVVLQIIVFKEMIALRYTEAKEKNLWGFRTLHWYILLLNNRIIKFFKVFLVQYFLLRLRRTYLVSSE